MKNILIIICLVFAFSIDAQNKDYYTKKGGVIEGFDVVSYFDNAPKKGSNHYVSTYKGGTFKFVSQKNMEAFNKNPEMYLPQYGGYCAYAIAVKGEKVSIDPETFEIRDGKLYLFYNNWGVNTKKSWLDESPNDLKTQADKNWKLLTEIN